MKKYLPILCLTLLPTASHAQRIIEYTYDGAGNRVSRQAYTSGRQAEDSWQTAPSEERMAASLFHDLSVKVCPNPTEGPLKVCLSGLKATDRCSLALYTPLGELILEEEANSDAVNIDLSHRPPGVYLLGISLNNETNTWKIVKK